MDAQSISGGRSNEKSLAYRAERRRDPHLDRQCLCMERPDAPHHEGDGLLARRDDLDLLAGHPVPRILCGLPRQLRREDRPEEERPDCHDVLRRGHARHGLRHLGTEPHAPVSLLRCHRRHRPRCWLHHASLDTRQILPGSPRLCDGPRHHGLRLCGTDRRSCHAVPDSDGRPRQQLPDPRLRLHAHHGCVFALSEAAGPQGQHGQGHAHPAGCDGQ